MGARISSNGILDHSLGGFILTACLAVMSPAIAVAQSATASSVRLDGADTKAAAADASGDSQPDTPVAARAAVPLSSALEAVLPDYSKLTHHELTAIGARWDELEDAERRALLQEVKMRMARQKGSEQVLQIRTQRRYGRIVRRSDGKVLRIETKVVRVRPVTPGQAPPERSFGVGFERRTATTQSVQKADSDQQAVASPDSQQSAPAVQVSGQSQ